MYVAWKGRIFTLCVCMIIVAADCLRYLYIFWPVDGCVCVCVCVPCVYVCVCVCVMHLVIVKRRRNIHQNW